MSETQKKFAAILKGARGTMSQVEFADHLGIVQQSYSRYEKGKVPDGEVLLQIALKLGLSTDELLGRSAAGTGHMELNDAPSASDLDLWRTRAKAAERELHELKTKLRELIK